MSWNDWCLGKKRELRGKSEINLARTLVILRDGLTLVRVANFSNRPMRLQADVPVANIILSVVGWRFFSFEPNPDSTSFPPSSCSVKNKLVAEEEKPKEDEKGKSDCQVILKSTPVIARQLNSLLIEYHPISEKLSSNSWKSYLLFGAVQWYSLGNMTGHTISTLNTVNLTSWQSRIPYLYIGQMMY